jgi:uncharacterized protein (TIGR00645 family)
MGERALEQFLERMIFASRWLLAPFFVGLILAIVLLLVKFGKGLIALAFSAYAGESDVLVEILTLVDTALLAVLLLIIILSGYESFVSKFDIGEHADRPAWMGKVGFADLKLKLIGAIVAISAVELLKAYLSSGALDYERVRWMILIHLTFAVSGVLFAVTDWIADLKKNK